ncbi:MAG: CPBP family intramembrane glutamic endopeptidase [bacterium]
MRTDAPPSYTVFLVFMLSAFSMIVVGGFIQLLVPLAVGLMLSEVLCVMGPALLYRRSYDFEWLALGPRETWPVRAFPTFVVIAATVGLGFMANVLVGLLVHAVPSLGANQADYQALMAKLLNPPQWWLAVAGAVAITVFAPVCESFVSGHDAARAAALHAGAVGSALNGVMFGAIHFNEMSLIPLSLVGAFFAWITWRTESLWPAIACHATMNAVNGVILPRIVGFDASPQSPLNDLLVALAVLGAILVPAMVVLHHRLPRPMEAQ